MSLGGSRSSKPSSAEGSWRSGLAAHTADGAAELGQLGAVLLHGALL